MNARNQMLGMAMQNSCRHQSAPQRPRRHARISARYRQEKASALGLSLADINSSLSTILGSTYVNDFIDKGRVKKVFVQGDAPFRMLPEDVNRWYLRNAQNGMVPFSAFSTAGWSLGSPKLERFNGSPSVSILGEPAPGPQLRRGDARDREMAKALPPGIGIEWAGPFLRRAALGSKSAALYTIALLMVFLCLAAFTRAGPSRSRS
jgi:multidrug efflux pump subunit AcrB